MYNKNQRLEKVITTVRDNHGNKIQTGIVKGGEYKTEEGYIISGGKYIAFQHWNMKRYLQSKQDAYNKRLDKVFGRFNTYQCMGITINRERLHAPLRGQPYDK